MIIPDINVLIYAADDTSPHHPVARRWWEETLSSGVPVGLPWVVATGFLRIATNRRIVSAPYEPSEAMDIVEGWLACPGVITVGPGRRHVQFLRGFIDALPAGGNLIPDAHLAAIAVEHDATLWSTDRGFARYDGLRWKDPLAQR